MGSTSGFNKVGNEYADVLAETYASDSKRAHFLYTLAPKSVIAAVAVSLLFRTHEISDLLTPEALVAVRREFVREWWALHENGIVPQKPPFPKPAEEV